MRSMDLSACFLTISHQNEIINWLNMIWLRTKLWCSRTKWNNKSRTRVFCTEVTYPFLNFLQEQTENSLTAHVYCIHDIACEIFCLLCLLKKVLAWILWDFDLFTQNDIKQCCDAKKLHCIQSSECHWKITFLVVLAVLFTYSTEHMQRHLTLFLWFSMYGSLPNQIQLLCFTWITWKYAFKWGILFHDGCAFLWWRLLTNLAESLEHLYKL